MSDIAEVVEQKNQQMVRLKLVNAGLVVVIVIAFVLILFLALLSRLSPPSVTTEGIDVLTNVKQVEGPQTITAGVPFKYRVQGTKQAFNGANGVKEAPTAAVRLQYVCKLADNNTSIVPFSDFYSSQAAGDFDLTLQATIPVSSRVKSADNCHIEIYAVYALFVTDRNGGVGQINFSEELTSNDFNLVVPDTETSTVIISGENPTPISGSQTGTTSTSSQNPNVAQSSTTNNSTSTTNNTSNTTNNPPAQQGGGAVRNVFDGLFNGLGL